MADPITIALVASTALSAVGAVKQGQAQSASYQAQANANEYNSIVNKNNADVANQEANQKEELQRRRFNEIQGQAYAGVAQSGTGFDGSNAKVLEQNQINAELDALNVRYQGKNQANGLLAQSEIDQYNAKTNRMNAKNAMNAGYINAGANLLSGATKAYYYSNTGKLS